MDKEHLLLNILARALHPGREELQPVEFTQEEFAEVCALAEKQNILPLLVEGVFQTESFQKLNGIRKQLAIRQNMMQQVLQLQKTVRLSQLISGLAALDLHPVVMKGIACRSVYPVPDARPSTDEDLLAEEDEIGAVGKFLLEHGFTAEGEPEPGQFEITYRSSDLTVELHRCPFDPKSPAFERLNAPFREIHRDTVTIRSEGTEIEVLGPETHMELLLLHAFKHFVHSGFGIRQVCDCMMWAEAYGDRIDFPALFSRLEPLYARGFTEALFKIAAEYLGFDTEKAAFPAALLEVGVPYREMLTDLLSGGVFGADSLDRAHSSTITMNAYESRGTGKRTGILSTVFPSAKALEGRYPYLRKQPWKLPVAWADRILHYTDERNTTGTSAAESMKIGYSRKELLKKLGIAD